MGVASPTVVHDWRRRYPEFPQPIGSVSGVFFWYWPDIVKWAKATGRSIVETG